ncbi:TPA: HNH endonuclease [Vibrio parahaemolyticus]
MAGISLAVSFNKEQEMLINEVMSDPLFKHSDWNKEELKKELQELRSYIREHYKKEQKEKCAYCQNDLSTVSALNCHVEHIVPKSRYDSFMFEPKNLCVACADCNQIKNEQDTLTPLSSGKARKQYPRSSSGFHIIHPHFDDYEKHLEIYHGKWYIDLTPKGHFTIGACKLNQRSGRYGIEEPDEMIQLAIELQEAKQAKKHVLVGLIKKRIRELCDE